MSTQSWKFWIIPLSLWGLYSCWYCGYQSGYADGHVTAWNMSRPSFFAQDLSRNKEAVDPPTSDFQTVLVTQ